MALLNELAHLEDRIALGSLWDDLTDDEIEELANKKLNEKIKEIKGEGYEWVLDKKPYKNKKKIISLF